MHRRRRHAAEVAAAAIALGALLAPGAGAHVTVQPSASRPADLQRYRVIVPNERTSGTTTGVDIQVPRGITFALVESVAGWRGQIVRRGGAIAELRWRGGRVAPGAYAELRFIARNPARVGRLQWKALQRYGDSDVVRWIGGEGSEQPAAVTTLSEQAEPIDVVSTHGEKTPAATGGAPAPAARTASDGGRDGLTLGLAIAGVVLGAAALGLTLARRRAGEQ